MSATVPGTIGVLTCILYENVPCLYKQKTNNIEKSIAVAESYSLKQIHSSHLT